ncbi:hypothetical protein BEP19_01045 [Ammoniphilus oxalaticus]|uniref:Cytochrome c domain-containing protein n=1 Tax=Ammoniphilus oxalaticus TaxID=66863 RepID=A0A419SMX8_9BACL|nr:cytochrome c [Ammoniphilus oxalaticus]RKD25561.1 hypothetical protein BEP19_01045 [Ammoniphilus oxalaticus]
MKKLFTFAISFALVAVLAACGGGGNNQSPPETPPATEEGEPGADGEAPATEEGTDEQSSEDGTGTVDVAAAEELYNNNCLMCHGRDLTNGTAPELVTIGSKYNKDEIADIIVNGKGTMPKGLIKDPADVELVATWLADHK